MWCKNIYQHLHMQHTEKELVSPLAIILVEKISCVFCRFDANQHSFMLFIIAVFGGDCTEAAKVWTCFFISNLFFFK